MGSNLSARYDAATEYVNAIHGLPPTYNAFAEVGLDQHFPQVVCDPVTPDQIQYALDRVNTARQNLRAVGKK